MRFKSPINYGINKKKIPEICNRTVQFTFPRDGYASWAASGPILKIYRYDMRSRFHFLTVAAVQFAFYPDCGRTAKPNFLVRNITHSSTDSANLERENK